MNESKIINLPDRQQFKISDARAWIGDELLSPFRMIRKPNSLLDIAWEKKMMGDDHHLDFAKKHAKEILEYWPTRSDIQELQRQASIVLNTPYVETDTVDLLIFLLDAHSGRNFDDVQPYVDAALIILEDNDDNLSPHAIARGIVVLLRDKKFFPSHQELRQAAADARAVMSSAMFKLQAMSEMIDKAYEISSNSHEES